MVRLNKSSLSENQLESLFTQLNNTLGKLSPKQTNGFLTELLGKEEKVMLAKRLAIIILLLEEISLYRIAKTLKVSPTAAEVIKYKLDHGDYVHIVTILGKNKKDYFIILDTLDSILHLGGILPHYGDTRIKKRSY